MIRTRIIAHWWVFIFIACRGGPPPPSYKRPPLMDPHVRTKRRALRMSATMLCDGTLPLGWLPRIPRGSHWYRQQTRSRYLIKIILGIKYILLSKVIYHLQSFKSKWAILYLIYLMIFGIDFSFYTFLALRPTCKFIIVHYFLPYFAYILPNSIKA